MFQLREDNIHLGASEFFKWDKSHLKKNNLRGQKCISDGVGLKMFQRKSEKIHMTYVLLVNDSGK